MLRYLFLFLGLLGLFSPSFVSAKPAKDRKEDQVSQNVHPYFIYYWLLEMDDDILMKNRHSFEGHLGENVSLNCQDKDNFNGNDDRFWRRLLLNGTLENLFFGSEKITADPRFGISRDGNLTIEDLSPGYFGIYDCSPPSHSPFSRGSIAYAVKAYIPPKVSAVKSMIVAPEDDQVTLKCMATGYPQPDIIWKRNYEEKEMFDDQIIAQRIWISSNINIPVKIQDVRKDTILYYKCYIGNEVITSYMSKWFTYEEILSAKPAEDQKEDRFPFPWLPSVRTNKRTGVHAYEYGSENVTFSCQVDDIGDDVRLWRRELLNGTSTDLFFGGEKITGDSRFRISRDGNLTIEYVYPDDSGKYICSVSNRSQTVLHTLYVGHVEWTTSGLVPNVATKLVKEEDGRVTLGCEATGILPPKLLSRPEIIWFKRKRDEKRNVFNAGERFGETITISTLTISNVNEAYGSFECMATNLAGTDEARISVEAQKWCFKEPSWKNCFIYTVKPEKMYWGDGVALCKKEGSASQNINSQAISANYVPPTNTRPTFTPATFAPVTRPIQPAAPLISAPRPPQVQPLQPALPTLPDTNPVALPAINRPVIQPINTDPNNVLLMPLQPTGPMPTISNLDVQCGKESMVVTVVFTQVFSGVIYAKGFHTRKECTFVQLNSGQASYTFTLVLDQCGTQFIDELGSGGQAYLENTIIIQMQEEIQEEAMEILLKTNPEFCRKPDQSQSGALKNLFPLLDRVLVEKARSGIEIPEKAQQKVLQATVVAVGPGARNNQSQHIPVTVKVGDKVLLPESGGTKVEIEDKEL